MEREIKHYSVSGYNFSAMLDKFVQRVKLKEYTERIPYDIWKKLVKLNTVEIDSDGSIVNIKSVKNELLYSDKISANGFGHYFYDYYIKKKEEEETEMAISHNGLLSYSISSASTSTKAIPDTLTPMVIDNVDNYFNTISDSYLTNYYKTGSSTNKTENGKENDKMKGFNFDFGPVKDTVHMSMYGMAIKNKNGTYVSYDKVNKTLMDVDILNFEGANKFMFKMPVPIRDIAVGDIIVHNGVPCFVKSVPDNMLKTFLVIDPYEAEAKEILIPKSMFGFDYATKVINLMEGMFGNTTASAENPFGNMLPLMLLSDGVKEDEMLPLMMMMSQNTSGTDMFNNPMMMYMMFKDNKNFDPMMLFAMSGMMNNNQHCAHNCNDKK